MNGPFLESGTLTEFQPLGAGGDTLFSSAKELRDGIKRQLGAEVAACFAIPQANERGDTLDWYAPDPGTVTRWADLSDEQRGLVRDQVEQLQAQIAGLSQSLAGQGTLERRAFGSLLEHAATIPDASHIFLIDDRPVLAFWGFRLRGGDPVTPLFIGQGPINLVPATERPAEAKEPHQPGRAHRIPWWSLLASAVAVLLLVLLWPRGGEEPVPPPPEPPAAAPPPDVLVIPPEAVETGSTGFLTGAWQATGDELVDSETKRPIVLAYELHEGQGEVTVIEQDGSVCRAPVDATFDGDILTLMPQTAIVCPNRDPFFGATVSCRPSTDGRAECVGSFPNGSSFRVEMSKHH